MLNFLRKLRRNEMNDKTGQYFKYAIGEVFLVVIGILIALSLNNWNTNRVNDQKKVTLLKSLQSEFTSNLTQLDTVMYYDNLVITSGLKIVDIIKSGKLLPQQEMDSLLANFGWLWTFNPLNGGLASGVSSGDIHLLKNDELKNLLFSWEDLAVDASEEEIRITDLTLHDHDFNKKYGGTGTVAQFYIPSLPEAKYKTDYKGLISDPEFENYVFLKLIFMYDLLNEFNPLRDKNEQILRLIEEELKY
jgi:uncharacterized protein DUF6090